MLTEQQANIEYIQQELKGEFGNGHILVTSNGLEISDSPGTRRQLAFNCKLNVHIWYYFYTLCRWDFLETAVFKLYPILDGDLYQARPVAKKIERKFTGTTTKSFTVISEVHSLQLKELPVFISLPNCKKNVTSSRHKHTLSHLMM